MSRVENTSATPYIVIYHQKRKSFLLSRHHHASLNLASHPQKKPPPKCHHHHHHHGPIYHFIKKATAKRISKMQKVRPKSGHTGRGAINGSTSLSFSSPVRTWPTAYYRNSHRRLTGSRCFSQRLFALWLIGSSALPLLGRG